MLFQTNLGCAISIRNIKCILSFSASANISLMSWDHILFSFYAGLLKCNHMPATIPGTPATVSNTTALCPYLCAKNVSAKNLKNFAILNAILFLIYSPLFPSAVFCLWTSTLSVHSEWIYYLKITYFKIIVIFVVCWNTFSPIIFNFTCEYFVQNFSCVQMGQIFYGSIVHSSSIPKICIAKLYATSALNQSGFAFWAYT